MKDIKIIFLYVIFPNTIFPSQNVQIGQNPVAPPYLCVLREYLEKLIIEK